MGHQQVRDRDVPDASVRGCAVVARALEVLDGDDADEAVFVVDPRRRPERFRSEGLRRRWR
jgi:hypothetical protein